MKMTREELIAQNKLERPNWTAEEFIATRVLREINSSGEKAYTHLTGVLSQNFSECEHKTRWDTAVFLLKRRIKLNLVVSDPVIIGLPSSAIEAKGKAKGIDGYIRESAYDNTPIGGRGPNFYIFRMPDASCIVAYTLWNIDLLSSISPSFRVYPGCISSSRIIVQGLDTFLEEIQMAWVAKELLL